MNWKALSLKMREFFSDTRTKVELGLLSLIWLSSASKYLNLALWFLDFFQYSPIYNLLVPFSLFFLSFSVWSIHRQLGDLKQIQANSRTGSFSNFNVSDQFVSKNQSLKKGRNGYQEDEGDDVKRLREELMKERKIRALVEIELEKERRAASSAIDEAMAKISLLQNEKGLIEREARQYQEIAKLKQAYDQEVVKNLQWIIESMRRDNQHVKI